MGETLSIKIKYHRKQPDNNNNQDHYNLRKRKYAGPLFDRFHYLTHL